jgi:hypothetical protein
VVDCRRRPLNPRWTVLCTRFISQTGSLPRSIHLARGVFPGGHPVVDSSRRRCVPRGVVAHRRDQTTRPELESAITSRMRSNTTNAGYVVASRYVRFRFPPRSTDRTDRSPRRCVPDDSIRPNWTDFTSQTVCVCSTVRSADESPRNSSGTRGVPPRRPPSTGSSRDDRARDDYSRHSPLHGECDPRQANEYEVHRRGRLPRTDRTGPVCEMNSPRVSSSRPVV